MILEREIVFTSSTVSGAFSILPRRLNRLALCLLFIVGLEKHPFGVRLSGERWSLSTVKLSES